VSERRTWFPTTAEAQEVLCALGIYRDKMPPAAVEAFQGIAQRVEAAILRPVTTPSIESRLAALEAGQKQLREGLESLRGGAPVRHRPTPPAPDVESAAALGQSARASTTHSPSPYTPAAGGSEPDPALVSVIVTAESARGGRVSYGWAQNIARAVLDWMAGREPSQQEVIAAWEAYLDVPAHGTAGMSSALKAAARVRGK